MPTIDEFIANTEEHLQSLREVRALYPSAHMETLWPNGRAVPVVFGNVSPKKATGLLPVAVGDDVKLFPYTTTPGGNRVYFLPDECHAGFYASLALSRLAKVMPVSMAALIEACVTRG